MLMVADTEDLEAVLLCISATLDLVTEERPELLMKERPGWMRLSCWASSLWTVPPDSGSTPAISTSPQITTNRLTSDASNIDLGLDLEK